MENVSACRFSPTDHGSICNSNILKCRVTTFWLDTLELCGTDSFKSPNMTANFNILRS